MDASLRVLLAVHGHEPTEWATRACRVLAEWKDARIRVLGVVDVPSPPLTSVIPTARRLYAAARSAWRADEAQRVQSALDRVTRMLSRDVEVVCRQSAPRGFAHTIVDDASGWAADVIVVAAPTPMSGSWWRRGPAHERLLRRGTGAVLAIPTVVEPRRTARVIRLPRAIPAGLRSAPADRRS
jgi:nucleotide-binding universal stress UspA family protein